MNMPPGACDCHLHVFEQSRALALTATFKPPHAPVVDYIAVQRRIGFERAIVVQPTGYAFDNGCTLDAIAALGSGARGVAVVPPDVTDAELQRLHEAGIRGVRFMMLPGGVLPWSALEPIAERIAVFGWHIDLQIDGREFDQHAQRLLKLPCRLVIDHIGKFLGPVTTIDAAFKALCSVLDGGRTWVKLSAPYESSRIGPPDYADLVPLVHDLSSRFPQACLWASNWPHPNIEPRPDDVKLRNWAQAAVGDSATWRRMLVDNPATLYGF